MHGRLCQYFLVFIEYSYCNRLSLGDIETIALYRTGGRGISKAEILVLHLNCFGPRPRCHPRQCSRHTAFPLQKSYPKLPNTRLFYFRSLVLAVVFRAFGQSPTDVEVAVFLYLRTREKELNCKVLTTLPCLASTSETCWGSLPYRAFTSGTLPTSVVIAYFRDIELFSV